MSQSTPELTLVLGSKNASSWSLRPWLVMRYFDIPFREIVIALDRPDTAARIAEQSPAGKVPVLRHGGVTVWDSLAIIEYLAEIFPGEPVWPAGRTARAKARAVSAEMHAGFAALRAQLPMAFAESRPLRADRAARADIRRIIALWQDCLNERPAGGPFLFGPFCAADAMFAPVVSRFRTYRVDATGAARSYMDAVWALPQMVDWLTAAEAERAGGQAG